MYNNKKLKHVVTTKTKGSQNKNSFAPLFWEEETSDDVDEEKKKVCYYRHSRHLTWQEEEGYSDVVIFINESV